MTVYFQVLHGCCEVHKNRTAILLQCRKLPSSGAFQFDRMLAMFQVHPFC